MAETRETPPYSCTGFLTFSVLGNTGCVIAGYNQMMTAIINAINTRVGSNSADKKSDTLECFMN
jgi:NADH:ubiquinone oxidoreductase subunit E